MKNERDFLASMWDEISKAEFDAELERRAKERSKKLVLKTLFVYGLITVICVLSFYGLLAVEEKEAVYLISLPLLLAAFIAENRLWRTKA